MGKLSNLWQQLRRRRTGGKIRHHHRQRSLLAAALDIRVDQEWNSDPECHGRGPMTFRLFRTALRSDRGTAAIEFGIVALPLLMLVLGIFEFARLYWTQEALQESATAGARCMGILQSSCS